MRSKTKTEIPAHIRSVVERAFESWEKTVLDPDYWSGDDGYDVNIYRYDDGNYNWRVAVYAKDPNTGRFDYVHVVWTEGFTP